MKYIKQAVQVQLESIEQAWEKYCASADPFAQPPAEMLQELDKHRRILADHGIDITNKPMGSWLHDVASIVQVEATRIARTSHGWDGTRRTGQRIWQAATQQAVKNLENA